MKSQMRKDAEQRAALSKETGQNGIATAEDMAIVDTQIESTPDDG